jgi:hypothetical protein
MANARPIIGLSMRAGRCESRVREKLPHALGFENLAQFSRYFRKQTGVITTEFQAAAPRDSSLNRALPASSHRATPTALLYDRDAYIVLRHRGRSRARRGYILELGDLQLLLERRCAFNAVHHARHPV